MDYRKKYQTDQVILDNSYIQRKPNFLKRGNGMGGGKSYL
jgi:hypothetical protein